MIVLVDAKAPREEVERLRAMLLTSGCEVRETESSGFRILFAERHWEQPPADLMSQLKASKSVFDVLHGSCAYPLVGASGPRAAVRLRNAVIGDGNLVFIAGPCTVETYELLLETARAVKEAGANLLRGGVFKPTTSPYSFQGHGREGLKMLRDVREETGLGIVTEVLDPRNVADVSEVADMLQIGARSMQHFDLLREVGRGQKPVLLKRAMSARINEWLCAAECIAKEGNDQIVLCERGIRTFENATRATLDISAIPVLKSLSPLPVAVDPSHAAGNREWVVPLALAAVAAGADAVMVEVHPRPEQSIKDGAQTISTTSFAELVHNARRIVAALSPLHA